ncbi:cupin domain-containing protein [Gramella sp. GC03-9]|uniref:Cupin domain-containing protein n=1 Tax=Christiangramia oceanisediminis TaxID=2920386 RepID=A0A9X2KY42_9FLAO|nr:cupin domain-containing protein [Gramella oceanisediminis]MCP9200397.1 cupin domain-containing protein [Gramella oceanisediminis]
MKTLFSSTIAKPLGLLFLILLFSVNMNSQEQSVAINILDGNLEWGNCPDFMPAGCNVSILHGDPAQGNTDAIFKIQPNTEIPEHWHNSAERMILIEGELEVTYEGEKTKTLKKGYYAYGPSKKPHTATCNDSGPCYLFVAFVKPVDAFPGKSD